jgi:two-component system CheB/CheR fusion protein
MLDTWVVGIGASAGGIEALRDVVPHLPQTGASYVVAQHMSPVHPSLLLQVLARETALDVVEVTDGQPLRPGTIHVVPPNRDVTVSGETLVIRQALPRISPQPSIDSLFTSLAASWGQRAIGVVLSGTGSDGALGVAAIKEAGGFVLVQDPDTAAYRDMPVAALDAGVTDLLLPPERIGSAITSLLNGEAVEGRARWSDDALMAALARETRKATGWDLAAYKDGTLTRQLSKRMHALGLATRDDYLTHATANPDELVHLRDSMLITVTGFLRDRPSFEALRASVDELIAGKSPGDDVRAWVAGCATGEEAYTVAMMLLDAIERRGGDLALKVFATDISDRAMDIARRGEYPESVLADVPAEWQERYVEMHGDVVHVRKPLRELVVFARQDITRDPPLVRMDLVTCRNLLIYLVPPVQQRVLTNLSAALTPEGLLFLGRSDAVPAENSAFVTLSHRHRIFRRGDVVGPATFSAARTTRQLSTPRPGPRRSQRDELRDLVRDRLLATYGPPSVLVDASFTPVHQVGDVARFLGMPTEGGDFVIADMVLPSLRTEVLALLSRVAHGETSARSATLLARHADGTAERVRLQVSRATGLRSEEPHYLVSFGAVADADDDSTGAEGRSALALQPADPVDSLASELVGTRQHLQAVVEELEASNEELQAMNEELQAASEELQATNEELETTNEELQATNEELTTVNETLEVRTTELTETNAVLQSIQDSVHTAILIVDTELHVLNFSPLAVKVFGVTKSDIGTDLSRLPSHMDTTRLRQHVEQVLISDVPVVEEVATASATYLLQVAPYRPHQQVRGAILALSDVTELSEARRALSGRAEEVQVLADAQPHMLFRADVGMTRFTYASSSAVTVLGLEPDSLLADPTLLNGIIHPDDVAHVTSVRANTFGTDTFVDYRVVRPDGACRVLREVSRIVESDAGAARVGTLVDITDLRLALEEADRQRMRAEGIYRLGGLPMMLIASDGRITDVNSFAAGLLDADEAELVGRPLADLAGPGFAEVLADATRRVSDTTTENVVVRLVRADGSELHTAVHLARVAPDGGLSDDTFVVASIHDLTELERSRQASEARREQFEAVFNHTGAAMAVLDTSDRIVRCNRALCELLGRDEEDLVGRRTAELTHPDDVGIDRHAFAELVAGRSSTYSVEKRFERADGAPVWGRLIVSAVRTAPELLLDEAIIMTLLDVSEERRREAAALSLSRSDPLTGLANRLLVFDRLEHEMLRARRVGGRVTVMFIDLDGFKGINDRLGHEVGDTVLRLVADRIRAATRETDSAARLGGDEFLVVAPHEPDAGTNDGMKVAERVRAACSEPIELEGGTSLRMSASIGLAQFPVDGDDVEELVRRGDTAMYAAKQRGGDQIRFYSERLQDDQRQRSAARAELSSAIQSGLIVPWYQPICDTGTGRPVGVEVLARWHHPDRGVLEPIDFLDDAEEFHLLDPMTARIVGQVIEDLPRLRAACPGLSVSVNLAAPQLTRSTVVRQLLEDAGPRLDGWILEVTEAAAFSHPDSLHDAMSLLREAGADLSLDDFGTGYSSVLHLREYGFDELKIDRAFVSDSGSEGGRALLVAMISMAAALGARTVGEGVETTEQREVLRSLGVDLVQGYLMARPADLDTTLAWLEEQVR